MINALTMPPMRALLLLAGCLSAAISARAQDEDLPPDEAAELVAGYVERGYESLRTGSYDEARLRFAKALRRDPARREARLGMAEAWRAVGNYDGAEAELRELLGRTPGDREARVAQAEIDLLRGREATAREALKAVIDQGGEGPDLVGLRARTVLAEALAVNGRRDEARTTLDHFLKYYEERFDDLARAAGSAEELRSEPAKARLYAGEMTLLARALRQYVELSPLDYDFANNAKELCEYARDLAPDHWEALIEWVRVTRLERESGAAKARKALEIARRGNPELADLYVEAARSILPGFNEYEARGLAETALKVNPRQCDAQALVARVLLEDNEYGTAEEHIEAGLAVNPRHRDLLALRATLKLLLGDQPAFEEGMKEVLAVDPTYGEAFHLAGTVVAGRQRRYDRAVELVRRGLQIDPMNPEAHASLGVFLANMGREKEAREALEASFRMFPFSHPVRDNFKVVLDYVIGTMTELRSERFVYRFDPGEYKILSVYLPPLLEGCWDDLTRRYGFEPRMPVLVQTFRKADDFSVRTLGLPGIPALGACFGGLITLDSPQALPPGKFSWASTARHEFTHVISLQLSMGQVPRWFTEGMSVLEEMPLDTGWGKNAEMERQMFDALQTGTLPKIATFDAMFRTPQVGYAYYVGGWMLRFLKERSGEPGLVSALRLFGQDRPMDEVFRKAFGLELADFDTAFAAYTAERVGKYRLVPNWAIRLDALLAAAGEKPGDGPTLLKVAWAYHRLGRFVDAGAWLDRARRSGQEKVPEATLLEAFLAMRAQRADRARKLLEEFFAAGGEDHFARMAMANYLAASPEDQERYVECLRRAKEDFPVKADGNNPYSLLATWYTAKGMEADALREIEEQSRIDSTNVDLRLERARRYQALDRAPEAIAVLEEALWVNLFDLRIHQMLLPLYRAAGAGEKALRSARSAVALLDDKVPDEAAANLCIDLAEICLERGLREEAQAALEEAKRRDAESERVKAFEARFLGTK